MSTTHRHQVIDKDALFTVDAIKRTIVNTDPNKNLIMQGDHNSERFTFKIPRYIEGHDMLMSNHVTVPFLNTETTGKNKDRKYATGVYMVSDLEVSAEDKNYLTCSWLISRNATNYTGDLNFQLVLSCMNGSTIDYRWKTDIFKDIHVIESLDADLVFEAEYVDVIEQWKLDTFEELTAYIDNGIKTHVDVKQIETNKNDISNLRSDMNKSDASLAASIMTQTSRIDQFTSLPEGSTTGNSELADIRVGANGDKYPNAGTAVREQYNLLDQKKASLLDVILLEQGTITATNGVPTISDTKVRSADYIRSDVRVDCPNGIMIYNVIFYDATTLEFSHYESVRSTSRTIELNGTVAKIVFSADDPDTPITPLDVKKQTSLEFLYEGMHANRIMNLNMLLLEIGGINNTGGYTANKKRARTVDYIQKSINIKYPDGIFLYGIYYYDALAKEFLRVEYPNKLKTNMDITIVDGEVAKLSFGRSDDADISISDIKSIGILETYNDRLNELEEKMLPLPSMVTFDIDHQLKDFSKEVADFNYGTKGVNFSIDKVYSLFDSLVSKYPDYVSKYDAAELVGLDYPEYASGTYDWTPRYKTYLYKFACSNSYAGNNSYNVKRKMLIVSGIHGDEIVAPVNAYLFVKQLCDGLSDPNMYKLRSAYDVYIMPCVNGYGLYHRTRANANGVNINRNFPIVRWIEKQDDTGMNYTGKTAGSEFETQLIMEVTSYIKPDLAIDHHNYSGNLDTQFYGAVNSESAIRLSHQCYTDCCVAFKTALPSYFGSGFETIKNACDGAPHSIAGGDSGTCNRWWHENQIAFPATIEVSECINYLNGAYANNAKLDRYGADTFAVAEYTLRNQILRYGQWILDRS